MRRVFAILIVCCLPLKGWGCMCCKKGVAEEFKSSDIVFLGKIVAVEDYAIIDTLYSGDTLYPPVYSKHLMKKFRVHCNKMYKGAGANSTIAIVSYAWESACGYQFVKGKKYVIYGNRINEYRDVNHPEEDQFYTSICTRTTRKKWKEKRGINNWLRNVSKSSKRS